jgi:hypothetical protein
MANVRILLDGRDVLDMVDGKVLFRAEDGRSQGTGDKFTGSHAVEIALTERDRGSLRSMFSAVTTGGGHKVTGDWPPCPQCKAKLGYTSQIVGNPPTVQVTCNACGAVVSTQPLNIP